MFTSCSSVDNPNGGPTKEEKNPDRAVFEKILSERLAQAAQDVRFESAMTSTKSLTEFLKALDENALKDQISTFLVKVVAGGQMIEMKNLSAQDKKAVEKCLKERFNMTDEELAKVTSFIQLDAYKTLNKLHLTFENGKCTSCEDAEDFTVEIVKSATERSKFQIKFGAESEDGLSFFPTRVGGSLPIALQLPKSFHVSLTTIQGNVMNGVIDLASLASSKYVSIKSDDWTIGALLAATINGRDELKQLREMGTFFAAGYEVVKALKGKSVEELSITLEDDLVISGSVDDVAKSMLALGNIRQLYGTQPGFEAIDAYTQELNKYVHFTVYQKSSGIEAQGTLLTIKKGSHNEYQPGLALQFKGEKEPQSMYENLSEEDLANYNKVVDNLNELLKECTTLVETFSAKIKVIGEAFKL